MKTTIPLLCVLALIGCNQAGKESGSYSADETATKQMADSSNADDTHSEVRSTEEKSGSHVMINDRMPPISNVITTSLTNLPVVSIPELTNNPSNTNLGSTNLPTPISAP